MLFPLLLPVARYKESSTIHNDGQTIPAQLPHKNFPFSAQGVIATSQINSVRHGTVACPKDTSDKAVSPSFNNAHSLVRYALSP
jgi:hypothetical protein